MRLDRWDLGDGTHSHYGPTEGLPGEGVVALAPDPSADVVWVAAKRGVAQLRLDTGRLTPVPAPAASDPAASLEITTLLADPHGGVWVGGRAGLFHADPDGREPVPATARSSSA